MYKKEIESYIDAHKQEMVEDIFALCRINSEKAAYEEGRPFGRGASEALDLALVMAEKYGFSIRNYDNFVGTADMNDKEKQLDILAHLDVVPAGEGWEVTQPFEPIEQDGKLYGRGTSDDKGPAVAALYAMRAVKDLGIPLAKNVRLILGTDEECGGTDIAHYYEVEKEAPMTFSPDAEYPVINVEKGGLAGHFTASFAPSETLPRLVSIQTGIKVNVVPGKAYGEVEGFSVEELEAAAHKTKEETGVSFQFDTTRGVTAITAVGVGAHAAYPHDGNNALTGLLTFLTKLSFAPCAQITAIHKLAELIPHGDTSGTALGIAMEDEISGTLTLAFSLLSVTDKELDGTFDSRCPICGNENNVLEAARMKMAAMGFTLLNETMRSPHHVDGNSHFVKTLLKVYEEYTGLKGKCQYTGGGTYVHDLKNGVAFGASFPGTDNRIHGADEFAVVEELVASAKIFAQVIVDLCGV